MISIFISNLLKSYIQTTVKWFSGIVKIMSNFVVYELFLFELKLLGMMIFEILLSVFIANSIEYILRLK